MRIETLELDEWDDHLPSKGTEVFHRPAALEVLDDHSRGDMRLYAGFKGDRAVAMMPVFVQRRSVGTAVLSPPPSLTVPRLGPLLMPASPKRRKRERINRKFVRSVIEETDAEGSLTLFRAVCPPTYGDPRPFVWSEFDVEPTFTYILETADRTTDDLLSSFSKSLRREIRDARELDVRVSVEGLDGVRRVFEATRSRYDEQGRSLGLEWPYVESLATALGDRCRTYVARDADGEYLSGVTVLYSDDAAYFWQGGARCTHEGVSVNSLVHWRIIEDVVAGEPIDSVHQYDLMGANTERLCQYKAKFGAELVPYFTIESGGAGMRVAKRAYQTLSD